MNLIKTLETYHGKLALRLLHGRKDPDEEMADGWGFSGAPLYFDWIRITYLGHINIGYGGKETGPTSEGPDAVYFHDDMLAVDRGGDVSYYGDWEIVPASEVRK